MNKVTKNEVAKFLEELLLVGDSWEVQSVSHQMGGVDRSAGRVTIELAVGKGQLVSCPKCGEMCKRHDEKMREWRDLGISNALSESINSKVQWIKRQACGYRSRERFRKAIYFHLGLDLYPRWSSTPNA